MNFGQDQIHRQTFVGCCFDSGRENIALDKSNDSKDGVKFEEVSESE